MHLQIISLKDPEAKPIVVKQDERVAIFKKWIYLELASVEAIAADLNDMNVEALRAYLPALAHCTHWPRIKFIDPIGSPDYFAIREQAKLVGVSASHFKSWRNFRQPEMEFYMADNGWEENLLISVLPDPTDPHPFGDD